MSHGARRRSLRGSGAALVMLTLVLGGPPATASTWFREVSDSWGVDFRHRHGGTGEFYMHETMGSGVVVLDFDGDGDDDLLWIDSGDPDPRLEVSDSVTGTQSGRSTLLRNDLAAGAEPGSAPRFVDRTAASGVRLLGYGMGGTAGDVDGDGDVDLVVTSFGPTQLLRNDGAGGFEREIIDRPAPFREDAPREVLWGSSAAFADADRDGDLDLYVTNYVDFDYDNNLLCGVPEKGLRSYCHPNEYDGLPDRFYSNDGKGGFADATVSSGFGGTRRNGLGVVWFDVDQDSWPDLYVANDMNANELFLNGAGEGGRRRFEDVAGLYGVALSDRANAEAGMGIAVGDWDDNGREDLLVTHLDRQTNALYSAIGDGLFLDQRFQARLAEVSLARVGFGAVFEDFDLDGDLDLAVANGHIIHNVEQYDRGTTYRQPNDLFENVGGRFAALPPATSGLDVVRSSRGLAVGDFDLDGRSDLAISNSNEPAEVYRNVLGTGGGAGVKGAFAAALRLRLHDQTSANGQAIGARVEAFGAKGTTLRVVRTGSSYQSQNTLDSTFALPKTQPAGFAALDLQITWPDGERLRLRGLGAGRVRVARQGEGR